ncbi:putative NTP pyrophosphohydrolase protein [Rhizobium phage RHph_X2_28B]|uniref:nucleotide pyrophosphohydrolase n=1 Tax=Rhizobium phage RHph_X2_28B TaxID=2836086 RepID=UPI00232937FB|nr:nucleotide pyrophosphohydrolase [Rhizobium phage RHph_X2_28B]QWY83506.1 putative NTP pyrophosphohydrolase protein [Rhizobium phage RHph_X2_28B]QWY83742.1 putative NTP pyrophosphohydrolase protein [Rhizobium phage RHph_X3_15]
MKDIHTLQDTKRWMEKAIPVPNSQNITTQMGVHFEEVAEMLDSLAAVDVLTAEIIEDTKQALETLSRHLKTHPGVVEIFPPDREEYLDSLCDQIVTAVGCAHNSGFDIVGAMNEVNRSNFSKFDEGGQPIFDDNRKIIKGPNYSKADLAPYV